MAVSDTIRWNAAAFQTKSFFCNTCVVRFVSLYYLTAIRYRAGRTVLAGGWRVVHYFGWKEKKTLFLQKILYFFLCALPDFQAFLRHCVTRTMASNSNQQNDSKFNLCSVQTRFSVETEEKPVYSKEFFIAYNLHVPPDFQAFRRHCSSDQRNDSVLTPKMWAVLGFLEEQS